MRWLKRAQPPVDTVPMDPTAPPTSAFTGQLVEPPPGYPITPDGWVTFQRVSTRLGVMLVQKRDGCSRTIPEY